MREFPLEFMYFSMGAQIWNLSFSRVKFKNPRYLKICWNFPSEWIFRSWTASGWNRWRQINMCWVYFQRILSAKFPAKGEINKTIHCPNSKWCQAAWLKPHQVSELAMLKIDQASNFDPPFIETKNEKHKQFSAWMRILYFQSL